MFRAMARIRETVGGFVRNRRGVAAVEFAIIVPLLLGMYFLTLEVSQGIEANKKVARIGSMVADLVTQQSTIQTSELDAIMKIGGSLLQPYNRSVSSITITAINITADPGSKVLVAWSRKVVNGSYSAGAAANSTTTVPAALNIPGSFLVRVESSLDYKPMLTWTAGQKQALGIAKAFDNIQMDEVYYLRPRMSTAITCTNC